MSTRAEAIIDQVRDLPAAEFREVTDKIMALESRRRGWEDQLTRLREMQKRHTGRGMLHRLLEVRAKERGRG